MSGLYSMLFGRNPASPYLLAFLGITQETAEQYPLGRIRDVYTNDEADRIFIFTRNGEYEEYRHVDEALAKHPNFVRKFVDDFDSTYATYEFTVPVEYQAEVKSVAENSDNTPPMEKFRKLLSDLESDKDNAMTQHAKEVGKKIFEPILSGDEGTTEIDNGLGSVSVTNFQKGDEA